MMENLPKYYFAFGSNMNKERMKKRNVRFTNAKRAILKDYRLVFNKKLSRNETSAANIEPAPGEVVEGILYELENPEEGITNLDYYEGYPAHYDRKILKVITPEDGKEYEAVVYVANPEWIEEGLKPSEDYFLHLLAPCKEGAEPRLSPEYCEKLRQMYRTFFGKEPPY